MSSNTIFGRILDKRGIDPSTIHFGGDHYKEGREATKKAKFNAREKILKLGPLPESSFMQYLIQKMEK